MEDDLSNQRDTERFSGNFGVCLVIGVSGDGIGRPATKA
jgi:hypothetical protein